ncbi:MAG: dienelactone hydrolase family protein [Ilumatobacteraceae bacterium]
MDRSVRISLTAWPTLPLTATLTEKNVVYTRLHMRIELASGTEAEVDQSISSPTMGLVVAPDIFGLRPVFDDLVARLAREWNMTVAAVDPFPGRNLSGDIQERFAIVAGIDDDAHLHDLLLAADVLGTSRVGLIGFCMGGMYCFKSARSDRFARIASFYGMIQLPEGWRSPTHSEPLKILRAGHANRVMAVVGNRDPYTPDADIAELRAAGVTVNEYPEAEHGFAHDPSRPSHRPDDAADAFAKAKKWLLAEA